MDNLFFKYMTYPVWDIYDRSQKLLTLSRLNKLQWESPDVIKKEQWNKLTCLMKYSYKNTGYYHQLFNGIHFNPNKPFDIPEFQEIPILTKKLFTHNSNNLISKEYDERSLVKAKTGGSTGVSIDLYFDKKCQEKRNAAELMADLWSGWDFGDKKICLWGSPEYPETIKQKIRNMFLDRKLYLDTMLINDETVKAFLKQCRTERPKSIFGHAHSVYIFAKYVKDLNIDYIKPNSIITTSMMLLENERNFIESVFKCKVTNRYGCEEVGLIACECPEEKNLHLNTAQLYVEIVNEDGVPLDIGSEGKLLISDLNNFSMPMIRYQIEDIGVIDECPCPCGRGFPVLKKIIGRTADFLIKKDGSRVAGVSLIEKTLTKIRGIEQLQIIQKSLDDFILNRVKNPDYSTQTDSDLTSQIHDVFGQDVNVSIVDLITIKQDPNGKYRFAICEVNDKKKTGN